ncbi:sigma-70 family RNA polymerase sigma factor [Paenibacillus sp. CAU 1782]
MEERELKSWLQKMAAGDRDAFREVYARIHLHVYRTVYFFINDKNEVEDVVNEVYAALFKALPGYDVDKPFKAWLNGIIIRQTSNWKRRLWRGMKLSIKNRMFFSSETQPRFLPEEGLFREESQQEILAFVDRLSNKLREVIVLRYYHESSFEEIAALLRIPVGTVKSRHHAAIRKLRRLMDNSVFERGSSVHVQ